MSVDGVTVWVCVAREGGLLEDIEVVGSEREAQAIVAGWAQGFDPEYDEDVGATIWYDSGGNDWYFDVWPKVVGTP
jgi:hypothetical protein